jgi:MSHA biogenesis protein MshI
MWSVLRRNKSHQGQTGVHRVDGGVAIAQIYRPGADARPRLTHCEYHELGDSTPFADAARRIPNRKWPVVSVLTPGAYTMLLVEAPDVAQEELRAAVRWRIKDLLDFHIDDAVIEVFQMPQQGRGGPTRMMYAIAARENEVRRRVDDASEAGLNLEVIDVLELSLRNIAMLLDTDGSGVAFLYEAAGGGILLLVRNGILYLARHIETGTEHLDDSAMRAPLVDGLALEVQRSLDYYESHYEQNSIPALYTWGLETWDNEQLDNALGLSVRPLELDGLFELDVDSDPKSLSQCLPAIGGALREEAA